MNKRGGTGVVVFIIIILILLAIGGYILFKSGAVINAIDPCESNFQQCNHGCGEGILSSICKEKCSYQYRSCKNG